MHDSSHATGRVRHTANVVWRVLLVLLLTASPVVVSTVSADQTANEPDKKLVVYVGVRTDTKPFSYRSTDGADKVILPGFGGFMIEVCRHVLRKMSDMPEYRNLEFRALETSASSRFDDLDKDGNLLMLCGPDSITEPRLANYHVSHPVFESGMTYAYLNPRSPLFPRGGYCKNIVGVVRGTTADLHGLDAMAGRDILMRFDNAVDLELNITHDRLEKADGMMRELIKDEIDRIRRLLKTGDEDAAENSPRDYKQLQQMLLVKDPYAIHSEVAKLENEGLAGRLNANMQDAYSGINKEIAMSIKTRECPGGFTELPIRKFQDHNEGVAGLCKGKVLYYLGDYDIISSKVNEVSGCNAEVVMNRFTRSKEVYGVFFSKQPKYYPREPVDVEEWTKDNSLDKARAAPDSDLPIAGTDCPPDAMTEKPEKIEAHCARWAIDIPRFHTTFNNLLLRSMQGRSSDIEAIFEREFVAREKSDELKSFFETFKISSYDD